MMQASCIFYSQWSYHNKTLTEQKGTRQDLTPLVAVAEFDGIFVNIWVESLILNRLFLNYPGKAVASPRIVYILPALYFATPFQATTHIYISLASNPV